jgi:hypothetical protein
VHRWRKALIAASVGVAASAAFVVASNPGQAQASLVANYLCTGGVAGASGGVKLEAIVTPQLTAAGMLDVRWSLKYQPGKRFGSPGFFPAGSTLNLIGAVDITGAWNGQLRPEGFKDQEELVPGDFLELPEGLSDAGSVARSGTIRVRPGALVVRFKPAKGEVMVNNHKSVIQYTPDWSRVHHEEEYGDHLYDLHTTTQQNASAKLSFTGTQVAYIGRREPGLGRIEVLLDGETVTDPFVEPGNDRSGTPMTGTKAKEVLWESPELAYGPHTVEIRNVDDATAHVDAFRVTTGDIQQPPTHNQATCTLLGDPGAIDLTVPGTSPTPTGTGSPTSSPTGTPTNSSTPSNSPSPRATNPHDGTVPTGAVVVTPGTARPTSTTTVTATARPTTTRYVKAQVAKTPKGGVDTGEAPEPRDAGSYGLIAGGSLLLMGSATGGLMLRRRATHSGGAVR